MDNTPPPSSRDQPPAPSRRGVGRATSRSAEAARLFATSAPDEQDPWQTEDSLLSWRLVATLVGLLVLIGFGAYSLFGDKSTTEATARAGTPAGAGGAAKPAAGAVDISDTFEGDNPDGLGVATTGQKWEIVSGRWVRQDGHATLVAANTDGAGRSIALVDLKSPNGVVSAEVAKMAKGWGLVFRYKGPLNFYMLTASPQFSTYNLVKVEDGKATQLANTDLTKQGVGSIVGVDFDGAGISILINNEKVKTVADGSVTTGTKVGLVSGDPSGRDAQWTNFTANKLAGPAAVGPATPTSAGPSTTAAKATSTRRP